MKKVFNIQKYILDRLDEDYNLSYIISNIGWAIECIDLTEEECNAKGYLVDDDYMVEVEDDE